MMRNKYEPMLDQFKLYYPGYYDQAVDWWASGRLSITVRLKDGTQFEFNSMTNTIRRVRTDASVASDDVVAKEFGHNLQKFITMRGVTNMELASRLGITNAMLSRYIHGTSMPSAGKAFRLAKALGCTIDELFDGTYMEYREED